MQVQAKCIGCLVSQIEKAYKLLRPQASNDEIVKAQKRIMIQLGDLKETRTPYYGKTLYDAIARELGEKDPYFQLKKKYNQIALNLVPDLENLIKNADNPLLTALVIAILGNTVDFGTPHQIHLEQDVQNFAIDQLIINHFDDFVKDFEKASKILIIGDNTGEVVFDRVMLDFFLFNYPKKEFIYAVRGGPAINDVTLIEAEELGITKMVKVVEGSSSPGVILEQASSAFQSAFQSADLIISKGQGNFESLDDVPTPSGPLYFLLKAKCDCVASMFDVSVGSLILYHRKSISDFN